MATTAFLGLGVMGAPMAGFLLKAGHDVCVYNRTASKAEAWVAAHGGRMATTPGEAAAGADFVFACVGNDDDLRGVCRGETGAFLGMKPDAVFVDHTTASAAVARELHAEAVKLGLQFIDAPVSGGQAGAESGQLAVMCGGDPGPYGAAEPVIMAYAKACTRMGGPGAGQLTKMVNQICIAGLVQGLSEGVAFAERAGLDVRTVMEAIGGGAAGSWQMANRHATMADDQFEFGFAVDWMRKDLGIVFAEAERNGADVPVARLVDGFYAEIQEMGGGRWDTSSLVKRLRDAG